MGIFDKIKKQTEVLTYKTAEAAEYAKARMNIARLNGKIEEKKSELGRIVYSHYINRTDSKEDVAKICEEIKKLEKERDQILIKLRATSNNGKICPNCNNVNPTDAKYCEKCGTKIEIVEENNEIKKEGKECPSCGKRIDEDSNYCSYCGTKLV